MIFVTVGAQMPFDRLIRGIDAWAEAAGRDDVFAQIGEGAWRPEHIAWTAFLEPDELRTRMRDAAALVAHAGTGSILTALELGKPILVMPRRAELRETRNDHQIATAQRFADPRRVLVADDEHDLAVRLAELIELRATPKIEREASPQLIGTLRSFIGD